jgi:hypothetical protein
MIVFKWAVPGHVPPLKDQTGRQWEPDSLCVAWCWSTYSLAFIAILIGTAALCIRLVLRRPRDLAVQ